MATSNEISALARWESEGGRIVPPQDQSVGRDPFHETEPQPQPQPQPLPETVGNLPKGEVEQEGAAHSDDTLGDP